MRVLLVLLAITMVCTAAALGSVAWMVWWLRRRNRVAPASAPQAPLPWLWSPTTPARLHRRLRTAVTTAAGVPRDPRAPATSRGALADEVEQQAVELDAWLIWAAHAPSRARRGHYRTIGDHVTQIEGLAMRLAVLEPSTTSDRGLEQAAARLARLADEVHQLEQASAEVAALDRLLAGEAPPDLAPAPDAAGIRRRAESG